MIRLFLAFVLCLPVVLSAANKHQKNKHQKNAHESLVIPYFPLPVVETTLDKFGVPERQKLHILDDLAKVDQLVSRLVVERGAKMKPNPLEEPRDDEAVSLLLKESITAVFTKIANKNGITNEKQIAAMISEIQKEKSALFSENLHSYADAIISR